MRKTYMLLVVTIIFSVMFLPVAMTNTQTQQRSQKVVIKVENGEQIDLYEGSYALLIGASDYTKGWRKLPGVKKDLEEIEKALKKQGFEVSVLLNPTFTQFNEVVSNFIGDYGVLPRNRLLVYFAGHGHTITTPDGRKLGYIVPSDAPLPKNKGAFIQKAISMKKIETYAQEIQSNHAIFLFDSCFSGSLFRSKPLPDAITVKLAKPVRQFITAGDENQEVPDDSVFRRQVVIGIEGEADLNKDGYVTGSELGSFLEETVTDYTKKSQTPVYGKIRDRDLDQGDFVFALTKSPITRPKIEIEREIPLGTLVIIANCRDMEILVDKAVVAKSEVAGEKITIKNIRIGRIIEVIGRVQGERDIVEKVELVAGTKMEISLGKIIIGNSANGTNNTISSNTSNNAPTLPVYSPVGTAVAPLMRSYNYETVVLDGGGNVKGKPRRQVSYYEENLGEGIKLEMVEVVGGEFLMGSSKIEVEKVVKNLEKNGIGKNDAINYTNDEGPEHKVKVPTFYMGKYEVTQGQWKAIMGNNPSGFTGDDSLPVESVSWEEAVEFCKKLSVKVGREYRLPSEAEWEYAARGGTTTAFGYGETINPNIVNYDGGYPYEGATKGKYRKKTVNVGSFPPNGYGLYEMHGNVWEWCQDIYQNNYKGAPEDGRAWEKQEAGNDLRVLRGGSWISLIDYCRSANRTSNAPDERNRNYGFRVVASARTL